jgi:hypothetical protein
MPVVGSEAYITRTALTSSASALFEIYQEDIAYLGCISPSSSTYNGLAKTGRVSVWLWQSPLDKPAHSQRSLRGRRSDWTISSSRKRYAQADTHFTPSLFRTRTVHLPDQVPYHCPGARSNSYAPSDVVYEVKFLHFWPSCRLKALFDQSACQVAILAEHHQIGPTHSTMSVLLRCLALSWASRREAKLTSRCIVVVDIDASHIGELDHIAGKVFLPVSSPLVGCSSPLR